MIHFFSDEVALEVGINGAIMLNHLHYWVKKNADNEMNYHDGYFWTYNSIAAYKKQFPFWSEKTIYRILRELEVNGYVKTGNYNQSAYDRTKWYALTEKSAKLLKSTIDQEYKNSQDNATETTLPDCPNEITQSDNAHLDKLYKCTLYKNKHKERHIDKHSESANCSPKLAVALTAFAEHRKKLKKPMTDYAKKLLLKKLQKLAKTEQEQIAILNQSIENGWQGVFPLGGERKHKQVKQSAADMADDVIRMMDERGMLNDTRGANENDTNAGGVPSWFSE